MQHAVGSHATVDQAIGVLLAPPSESADGRVEVLRKVSQRTDVKLHTVAEALIDRASGRPAMVSPNPVFSHRRHLDVRAHACPNASDRQDP
ncbi:ANTAR domain-containing protein [Streptomyces sp. NPDC056628]|uniref:ANTAR domain-containing protein n=1 Tax=Streptomyces sp. NPDC056628 TaxID=3345882 RepID=UPI0036B0828E